MADFVINEWIWSDLSGENGLDLQRETFDVVLKFHFSRHRIVIIKGSQFDLKAWSLCRNENPMIVQRIGGAFVKNIRQSERCLVLSPQLVDSLPDDLASAVKPDDHYLVQAQRSVAGAILVTTDEPLRDATARAGLPSLDRKDFLRQYIDPIRV